MSLYSTVWAWQQDPKRIGKDGALTEKPHWPAKLLLLALADYPGINQQCCWPSQKTLSQLTGMSIRQVRICLSDLEAQALIARQHRKRKDGSRASDTIWLLGPKEAFGPASAQEPPTEEQIQPAAPAGPDEIQPAAPAGHEPSKSSVVKVSADATTLTTVRDEPEPSKKAARKRKATLPPSGTSQHYVGSFVEMLTRLGLSADDSERKAIGAGCGRLLLKMGASDKVMMATLHRMAERWAQGYRVLPERAHGDVTGVRFEPEGKGGGGRRGSPEEVIRALENYENKGKTDLRRFAALARSYDFTLSESPPYGVIKALGGTETEANQNLTRIRSVANKALKASRSIEDSSTQTTP